jgi:hypothetical protein
LELRSILLRNNSNTVTNGIKKLKDLEQPKEKTAYIVEHVILPALGDEQSKRFYELVAAKIPEQVIREILSEVRVDGARDPAKLFTYKIQRYALAKQKV